MRLIQHIYPALGSSARTICNVQAFPISATILLFAPLVYLVCGVMMIGGIGAVVLCEVSAFAPRFSFMQNAGIASLFGLVALLAVSWWLGSSRTSGPPTAATDCAGVSTSG